ncbi:hypothetical protein LI6934_12425 [Bacillus licheniformis LMG 6934]|nr:hypothetical protein LI6934_12425 [Bacillus licheniformis LMG 6934]
MRQIKNTFKFARIVVIRNKTWRCFFYGDKSEFRLKSNGRLEK